jgi:hypothetical protein
MHGRVGISKDIPEWMSLWEEMITCTYLVVLGGSRWSYQSK